MEAILLNEKVLNKTRKYNGITMTRKQFIHEIINGGFKYPKIKEVPRHSFNRTLYNRMNGIQQEEYDKKLKETKIEYQIADHNGVYFTVLKCEYEYAQTLLTFSAVQSR